MVGLNRDRNTLIDRPSEFYWSARVLPVVKLLRFSLRMQNFKPKSPILAGKWDTFGEGNLPLTAQKDEGIFEEVVLHR
jgi:hypothetical protein